MGKMRTIEKILDEKVIAIIRARGLIDVIPVVRALLDGGIHILEVSFNTPGAVDLIRKISEEFGDDVCCGAGTVVDGYTAMRAMEAGSRFIISPIADEGMMKACITNGIPVIPGAFTAAEIYKAFACGAPMVKVFPAEPSGPEYIKAIKAVFPQIPMVAVGGVDAGNAKLYLSKGASAVAVGTSIVNDTLIKTAAYEQIRKNARHMKDSIVG
jgi:2-dehydro-3-deoxyphosphogluconate aldolase/(4S)-4-hydroxy-2-oxoglutarate aldolase